MDTKGHTGKPVNNLHQKTLEPPGSQMFSVEPVDGMIMESLMSAASQVNRALPLSSSGSLQALDNAMNSITRISDEFDIAIVSQGADQRAPYEDASIRSGQSLLNEYGPITNRSNSSTLSIRRKSAYSNLRGPYSSLQSTPNRSGIRRMNPFLSAMNIRALPEGENWSGYKAPEPTQYPPGHILNTVSRPRRARTVIGEGVHRTLNHQRSMAYDPKVGFSTLRTMSSMMLEKKGLQWENVVAGYNNMGPKEPLTVDEAKEKWNALPHVLVYPEEEEMDEKLASDIDDYNLELHCCQSDSASESVKSDESEDDPNQFDKPNSTLNQAITDKIRMQDDSSSKNLPNSRVKKSFSTIQEQWIEKVVPTLMAGKKELSDVQWKTLQEFFFNEFHELKLVNCLHARWNTIQKRNVGGVPKVDGE